MKQKYCGGELELFLKATNWKQHVATILLKYIGEHVLEVGAGIGGNTNYFHHDSVKSWKALEPDNSLCERIAANVTAEVEVINGTIHDVSAETLFDTILYFDVLEHIKDDFGEMYVASRHLSVNGNLIIIAPAHQFLYSPFDHEVGHWRRYSENELNQLCPEGCIVQKSGYLDSCGYFLSLANKVLLKQRIHTLKQIMIWDKYWVPASRLIDPIVRFKFGKSVFTIFKKKKD